MATRQLEKKEWRVFFDQVSRGLIGKRAEIRISAPRFGDQIEAGWLPLLGITYNPKNDIVEIALDGLDHMIRKPRVIYVDDTGGELTSLEVVDSDKATQIVRLREPPMVTAPSSAG